MFTVYSNDLINMVSVTARSITSFVCGSLFVVIELSILDMDDVFTANDVSSI